MFNRLILLSVAFAATVALGGCARLAYVKVPTPTQYETWTDQRQELADKMEGVRYYLPRPFLHLKQSVPVAQRVAFISFQFETRTVGGKTEQGYYLQMPENPPTWLVRLAPGKLSVTQALAASLVSDSRPKRDGEGGEESTGAGESPDVDKEGEDAADRPASELTARTGFISDTDPVTRLGELMDVVYLPDFEEQYVIRARRNRQGGHRDAAAQRLGRGGFFAAGG